MRRLAFTWDRRFFSLDQPPSAGRTEVHDQTDLEVLALVEDIFAKWGHPLPEVPVEFVSDDGTYNHALTKALQWLTVAQARKLEAEVEAERHKQDVELAEKTYEEARSPGQEPWNDLPTYAAEAWVRAVKALRKEFES